MRPARILVFLLGLMACDLFGPKVTCACDPALGTADFTGTVSDPSKQPAAGAVVWFQLLNDAPCVNTTPAFIAIDSVIADGSGVYTRTSSWFIPANKCWRTWASAPIGSALKASDTSVVNTNFTTTATLQVSKNFQLRP